MIDISTHQSSKLLGSIVSEIPDSAVYRFYVNAEVQDFDEESHNRSIEYWKNELYEARRIKNIVNAVHNIEDAKKLAKICGMYSKRMMELNARALDLITKRICYNHMDFDFSLAFAIEEADQEVLKNRLELITLYNTIYDLVDEKIGFKQV